MTVRAPGTNSPLRRDERDALERRDALVKQYMEEEGMTEEAAKARVHEEMRDNPTMHWLKGSKSATRD